MDNKVLKLIYYSYKNIVETNLDAAKRISKMFVRTVNEDGGEGSGNWGHSGRPGEIGGSAKGGGEHNRQTKGSGGYTSFSKLRKSLSRAHRVDSPEEKALIGKPGVLVVADGKTWKYDDPSGDFICLDSGEYMTENDMYSRNISAIVPDSANPNYDLAAPKTTRMKLLRQMGKAFNTKSAEDADKKFRKQSGEIWMDAKGNTKEALYEYTGEGYRWMNPALREEGGIDRLSDDQYYKLVAITEAIEDSKMREDVVVKRGISTNSLAKLVGLDPGDINPNMLSDIVGVSGVDRAFASAAARTSDDAGFYGKAVQMEVLLPKGTKALYVEPFSANGMGDGLSWNGEDDQFSISDEQEMLIQRGSEFVILDAKYDGSKYQITAAVVSQDYEEFY